MIRKDVLFLILTTGPLFSQQPSARASQTVNADSDPVIVTGTFEPVPLSEANRAVLSLDTPDEPLLYNSFVDYLYLDPCVDLKQCGTDGVQADLHS